MAAIPDPARPSRPCAPVQRGMLAAAMSDDARFRIAVGENHPDLAESLCMLIDFQPDMQSVGHASSSAELLEIEERSRPDAWVLDLSLDDGSSIPLMKTLRGRREDCVIIAYTGHSNPVLSEQCQRAGCDLVITKAGPVDELLDALRGALKEKLGA